MFVHLRASFFLWVLFSFAAIFSPASAQEEPEVSIGGALRFNYNLSSWKPEQMARGGDFGYDMFRINAVVAYRDIYLNAEYRHYSEAFGGGMLKQGWFGYWFNETDEIQVGLTQVPFGIQTYNSNNWFFNLTYYMGLEDDHDMGIKYVHTGDKFDYHLAFFKNAEELRFGNDTEISPNRYSYDVAGRNKEINQFNGKILYKTGDTLQHRIGFSVQYGGLYNLDTEQIGDHYALALHYEATWKEWNLKAASIVANHNPKNEAPATREIIRMAAYGAPYEVAADFNIYTLTIARDVEVNWGPVSNLRFYNDFGFMQKHESSFEDSYMNVTGILLTAGNIFTYIDYAAGKNHSWLGGNFVDDFSTGNPNAQWEARFNINFGYYF